MVGGSVPPDIEPAGYDAAGPTVPWRHFLDEATQRLRAGGFASPETDARRIVEQASGADGAELVLTLGEPATKRGVVAFDRMLARRLAGEPLQYVVGSWGFRTLDLMVDRRVLIPRPETEVVAGVAIAELDRVAEVAGLPAGRQLVAADLGTGSGAIGLSIAVERPACRVVLSDASPDALAVARANLSGIGSSATRVTIVEGDWFAALPPELAGGIDVVVSNPPYVAPEDTLPSEVADWEPTIALAAESGLVHLRALVDAAHLWLRPGGALVLEMAPAQTEIVAAHAATLGYVDVAVIEDLAGRPRAVRARTA